MTDSDIDIDNDNVEADETYGDVMEPIREAAEEIAEPEPQQEPEPEPEPVVMDLGLTESVEESDEANDSHVYSAQNVDQIPKPLRQGMEFFAAGARRGKGQKKKKATSPRVNRYTSKSFPGQELAPPTRTTFK